MADAPRSPPPRSPDTTDQTVEVTVSGDRLGVKALLTRAGDVLLVREGRDDGSSFWTLPGGGVAPGESLRSSLRRELDEELRCSVTCGDRLGTCRYDHTSFGDVTTVYTVFECTLESKPVANAAEDIHEFEWIRFETLPDGLLPPFEAFLTDLATEAFFEQ